MLMTPFFLVGRDTEEIEDQLTDELKKAVNWLNDDDLIVNLNKGKTESMLLGTKRRTKNNTLKVYLNGQIINFTNNYKYLGVLVD